MIENTEAYKGRKFTCKYCGYVVSSDATDDFDVEDFSYCPYCGEPVQEVAKEYGKEVKNCATCANYTDFDEIDNGCYMCCKGLENNYVPKSAPYQKGE